MFALLVSLAIAGALFVASGTWYGANQCVQREELKRHPLHSGLIGLAYAGGAALFTITVAAILKSNGHADLPLALLYGTATCEFGVGSVLYSAGCM